MADDIVRVTQQAVEVFNAPTSPAIRATAQSAEVFLAVTAPTIRATSQYLEVLRTEEEIPATVRVSSQYLEVLRTLATARRSNVIVNLRTPLNGASSPSLPGINFITPWAFTDAGSLAYGHNGSTRNYNSGQTFPQGALWSISNSGIGLRITYENSANCGGSNSLTQSGTATASVYVTTQKIILVSWEGIGELQDSNFDAMTLKIDGNTVGLGHAAGGGLGCQMGPIVSQNYYPSGYTLAPGMHTIEITSTTNDGLYHVGSYYQFNFELVS